MSNGCSLPLRGETDMAHVLGVGRQRLYPEISDPSWMILRRRREIFCGWLERMQLKHPKVLDVGGRIQPYRELISSPGEYWAVDLRPSALVNAVANAEHLPFCENHFDLAICTQMLEYARDPASVVREIHRVLRPNGFLLLSAPSIFPRDSEYDRWRFLRPALVDLLSDFSASEIVPECGSVPGMLRTAAVFLHNSARYRPVRAVLGYLVIPLLNAAGAAVERILGSRDGSFTANYSALAMK